MEGALTVENLQCANNQCTFDLYGGNGVNDIGVATLFFGDRLTGFCGAVIPDGSKATKLEIYPVCLDATASPLQQRANSHDYSFTVKGASTPIPPNPPQKYKVGDVVEGGIVIDVDSTGEHGVAAFPTSIFPPASWGIFEDAATFCAELKTEYSNWRLPTIQELSAFNLNSYRFPDSKTGMHWSSSVYPVEPQGSYMWTLNVGGAGGSDGSIEPRPTGPTGAGYGRCVRSF